MASISLSELRAGVRLAYDLRDGEGRLLLSARKPLTEAVLGALVKRRVGELSIREASELPAAVAATAPRRAWLMAAGVAGDDVEGAVIEEMAEETVEAVETPAPELAAEESAVRASVRRVEHRRSVARIRSILRSAADEIVAARTPRWRRLDVTIAPEREGLPARRVGFGAETAPTVADLSERVEIVKRMMARLASGEAVGAGTPIALVDEMIEEIGREPFAAVARVIVCARSDAAHDLNLHAYVVASMCAAVALHMGWSEADARSGGLAGLLADCGLALLPWDIRHAPRELTDVETNALRRHPAWSAGMLELIHEDGAYAMDEAVQLAVYQHHEREDGMGYPARARCETIHDLARLVAVADTFVGLISPRAHRPGLSPESALAEVVRAANAGTLARAMVRGLALALGLRASHPAEVVVPERSARVAA
jgi:HD-GYP domain-containing protein (c-di-GMP phosphodiesterase class II)